MTQRKPRVDESAELKPEFIYRKHSPVAIGVIGLGVSQIDEQIKNGALPPLVRLGPGRAVGWYGSQLIELRRQRIAAAEAEAAERQTARQQEGTAPAKPRGRPKKVA
jgi:predicted DNA-binding transcriptional regulator AlpA